VGIFGSVFAKCFYGSYFIVLMEKSEPSKNNQIKKIKNKKTAGRYSSYIEVLFGQVAAKKG
jgi:hypothetical protein